MRYNIKALFLAFIALVGLVAISEPVSAFPPCKFCQVVIARVEITGTTPSTPSQGVPFDVNYSVGNTWIAHRNIVGSVVASFQGKSLVVTTGPNVSIAPGLSISGAAHVPSPAGGIATLTVSFMGPLLCNQVLNSHPICKRELLATTSQDINVASGQSLGAVCAVGFVAKVIHRPANSTAVCDTVEFRMNLKNSAAVNAVGSLSLMLGGQATNLVCVGNVNAPAEQGGQSAPFVSASTTIYAGGGQSTIVPAPSQKALFSLPYDRSAKYSMVGQVWIPGQNPDGSTCHQFSTQPAPIPQN